MSVVAVEGVVNHGLVRLPADLRLPENAKVYVVVPIQAAPPQPRVVSPRLKHPQDAIDFQMEVIDVPEELHYDIQDYEEDLANLRELGRI